MLAPPYWRVLLCISTSTHAEAKWWRATSNGRLELAGAMTCVCQASCRNRRLLTGLAARSLAILMDETALARDQFLLVTDADARDCIQETSASTTKLPPAARPNGRFTARPRWKLFGEP